MQFTKDQVVKQGWSITWDNPTKATPGVFYKLLELAFEQCGVLEQVGVGYNPTAVDHLLDTGVAGFVHWVDWNMWAMIPKGQREEFRDSLFRHVPPGVEINCAVFRREESADRFKEILEQRIAWLALGGDKYWMNNG